MNQFDVEVAFLHAAITIPGVIPGDVTLSQAKFPGIKMSYTQFGLIVELGGKKSIIPLANVKNVILAPEDKKLKAAK